MDCYKQILYHITITTSNNLKVLDSSGNQKLFKFIWKVLQRNHCQLYWINGTADHVHIVCELNPAISLIELINDIKLSSKSWIFRKKSYPQFSDWADDFSAFTFSIREKPQVIRSVKNQALVHLNETYHDEFVRLLMENGVSFNEDSVNRPNRRYENSFS